MKIPPDGDRNIDIKFSASLTSDNDIESTWIGKSESLEAQMKKVEVANKKKKYKKEWTVADFPWQIQIYIWLQGRNGTKLIKLAKRGERGGLHPQSHFIFNATARQIKDTHKSDWSASKLKGKFYTNFSNDGR